jgi:hypothetical protein
MFMFETTSNKYGEKDQYGKIHQVLEHIQDPFFVSEDSLEEPTPEKLADQYLARVAPAYQINDEQITDLSSDSTQTGTKLYHEKTKEIAGSIVVNYSQKYNDIPVWGTDFSVHIASNPMRVTSSSCVLDESIKFLGNDPEKATQALEKLTPETLSEILGSRVSKINQKRLVIYLYNPKERIEAPPEEAKAVSFESPVPKIPLPDIPETIQPGTHYAVVETLFDLDLPQWKDLHWRALIEPASKAVLYLRALISGITQITGKIFPNDPISLSGDATLTPAAPEESLNALRKTVQISDLTTANPKALRGNWVDLAEIEPPNVAEPTTNTTFDYAVKTPNFGAVNAYYHINWFFNLIKDMGFNLNTYFDGTTFPVPVDHWSLGGSSTVNAHCPGNTAGNGIGHFCFASAQKGETVSLADDVRVVIHEFGHGLLWDHVSSPNFGFCHSSGDALAAILLDPESKAPDRFLTFPWPQTGTGPLDRRHDRKVADGWGWFGRNYDTQYGGEQVLSTTLFRLYLSVGGDSPHLTDKKWASRYVSYLIIKAIGTLTHMTRDPREFVTALMNADITTNVFEGHTGGALHKVIRWAFEKQGLYQPNAVPGSGIPVTREGNPPEVDVYIDDGRHGEYQYLDAFWKNPDMWVRNSPDSGVVNQAPVEGQPNYMYVKVKNRGTKIATNVKVTAYHCKPESKLIWPNSWNPMDTPQLPASRPIPPGGELIVGPFEWTPEVSNPCLLAIASADGDPSNDMIVKEPILCSRFVPLDNNICQRNIVPLM